MITIRDLSPPAASLHVSTSVISCACLHDILELRDLCSVPGGHKPDGSGPDKGSPLERELPDKGERLSA